MLRGLALPQPPSEVVYTGTTTPSAPTAGLRFFTRKRAGRYSLCSIDPNGIIIEYGNPVANKKIHRAMPAGAGSTVLSTDGISITSIGSNTAVTFTPSSLSGTMKRLSQTTSAATAQINGWADLGISSPTARNRRACAATARSDTRPELH